MKFLKKISIENLLIQNLILLLNYRVATTIKMSPLIELNEF